MNRSILQICVSFLIFLMLFSCMDKSELEREIKKTFQQKMDTDPEYKKYGMKTQKVTLIKSGTYSYDGVVTVLLDGSAYDVPISVKADGSSVLWETKPLAFAFLFKHELKNIFK